MKTWYYSGPAYRFEQYVGEVGPIYTIAETRGRAKTNILHKLRKQLGLVDNAKILIDDVLIIPIKKEKTQSTDDNNIDIELQYCEKCGTLLNDNGECPICDLGEEDY